MKSLSLLLAAATLSWPAAVSAQDAIRSTERVSLASVRFDDEASMRELRSRIRQAARRVCGAVNDRSSFAARATSRCRTDAVADAEAQLGRFASLTRYAAARSAAQ